jgi:23S rRNA (cytidine1920-2'-O)/16S rRNA (cytidine1409-2'-O)-methyltransferase
MLVERGLAESRERAQALILEGLVYTSRGQVLKPSSLIPVDAALETRSGLPYVGRGGLKLAHALDRFGMDVSGLVVLDVGASTGGFTDCLLQRGARNVIALDVGHGQLDYRLRMDPRVTVMEKTNARYPFSLPPEVAGGAEDGAVELATVDVSFISLTMVLAPVAQHVAPRGAIIALVKPQFEARRGEVGRGGVIKDPRVHARVLGRVILWVISNGFRLRDLVPSPILGDAGNREFFVLLRKRGLLGL